MARFSGLVGFVKMGKNPDTDIWSEESIEKRLTGDYLRVSGSFAERPYETDDVGVDHRISLLTTKYLSDNLNYLRYIVVGDTPYKVSSYEIPRQRVMVSLGGVYNGDST